MKNTPCQCANPNWRAFIKRQDLFFYYNSRLNRWVVSDPRKNYIKAANYCVECLSCHSLWTIDKLEPIYSPDTRHDEIVCDLDSTLFFSDTAEFPGYDFSFKLGLVETGPKKWVEDRNTYYTRKRPSLDIFIKYCLANFERISFFTSAVEAYAKVLIDSLNLPPERIGFVKTRRDTVLERAYPLSSEREAMKPMDHRLILEDKPYVIKGNNNVIIRVNAYLGEDNDSELLKVIKKLKKAPKKLIPPKNMSGVITINGVSQILEFKKTPFTLLDQVLNNLPRISFVYNDGYVRLHLDQSDYQDYLKIFELFGPWLNQTPISSKQWHRIIPNNF